jgi:hypothetical protein
MAAPETEEELRDWLAEMIFEGTYGPEREADLARIRSFEEAGLLTADEGLVLSFREGPEFQLTIVRSG